jgi:hypothetical protein
VSQLARSLAAKPPRSKPICKRCRRNPTTHTVLFRVNEVGPKRNGSGPRVGSRVRTVCEACATELTGEIVSILDRGESA